MVRENGEKKASNSAPTIPRGIFTRQLLLMAAYNPMYLQGLGFAYAVQPALEEFCRASHGKNLLREQCMSDSLARHLVPFNTNPYLASAVIGAVAGLELEGEAKRATRLKNISAGPLGSIGDLLIWRIWLPAAALAAAFAAVVGLWWAFAVFLALFSLPQLLLRYGLTKAGFLKREQLLERLVGLDLVRIGRIAAVPAACLAALTAWEAGQSMSDGIEISYMGLAVCACAFVLSRSKMSSTTIIFIVGAATLAVPFILERT